jgi:TIGR03009 family protein
MRSAGFLSVLLAASVVSAQPPAVPGQPVTPVPPPAAAKAADPKLDAHLAAWEKKMAGVTNVRTEIELKRTDNVFKKDTNYKGVVLCMKPNFAVLRLENAADPTKADYEAYLCDGKSLYVYEGLKKTVTEITIPQNQAGVDNLMLDFLAGMKASVAKQRFDITLFKADEYYIYLDVKPLRPADQREFKQLRLALYGPGPATAKFAYLPAQVFMLKPNDDTEVWKFTNTQVDVPGVDATKFKYVPIKNKDWKFQKAPPQPVGGAGGAMVPAGGAVRQNAAPPGFPRK